MAKVQSKTEAVRLKQEGKSLTQIANITGLSRPTIVKAYKAFLNGTDSTKSLGRPKLQSKYINQSIIDGLVESRCVFNPIARLFNSEVRCNNS